MDDRARGARRARARGARIMTRPSALETLAASSAFATPARAVQRATARGTSNGTMVRGDEVDDAGAAATREARESGARTSSSSAARSSSSVSPESEAREKETTLARARRHAPPDGALPYSEEDTKLLKTSLMRWVRRVGGVVSSRHARGDLETAFADGVSLCDLVEKMDGAPVLGVFRSPKTEATREANRKKAVERLLRVRNMSRRFLTTTGELNIVGVLEDCRVFMDGLPPRPKKPWDARTPYVPDVDGYGAPDFEAARRRRSSETPSSAVEARTFDDARAATKSFRVKISSARERERASSAPTARPRPRRRPTPTKTDILSPTSAREITVDPEDAADHVRWLARQKFWPRDVSAAVADDPTTRTVDVFTDVFRRGIVLCDIVERFYRVSLPGVTRSLDPSRAAALHNVSVALRELRRDVRVSTRHLWSERAIARGDPSVCSCILSDVRARVRTHHSS